MKIYDAPFNAQLDRAKPEKECGGHKRRKKAFLVDFVLLLVKVLKKTRCISQTVVPQYSVSTVSAIHRYHGY